MAHTRKLTGQRKERERIEGEIREIQEKEKAIKRRWRIGREGLKNETKLLQQRIEDIERRERMEQIRARK